MDVPAWEGLEVVLLEKVIHTQAEQLGYDADVIPMVKLLDDVYALTDGAKSSQYLHSFRAR